MALVTISYAPGSWILIAGRDINVLLPGTEKQRAAAVWSAIDSGAGFAEALDAVVSAGLAGLSGFALVATDGDNARVVVRGDLRVELRTSTGTTPVVGSGTWAEQSVNGVEGVSVWPEDGGQERFALQEGLVRAAGFASGTASAPPAAAAPVAAAPVLSLVPSVPLPPFGAAEPAVEPEVGRGWDEEDLEDAAEEPLDAPDIFEDDDFGDSATDDFGALGILPDPEEESEQEEEPEHAAGMIPPPPAFPPPGHAPAAFVAPEPVEAPEPVAAPEPVLSSPEPVRLAFSHGDNVEVNSPVVVGRAPHPDRYSHLVDPLVVRVPSPHQEISGTHVAIAPGGDGEVQVTDLGSTNGTLIIRGGGTPEELRPGVSVHIGRGDTIDLGDGLTIRVV